MGNIGDSISRMWQRFRSTPRRTQILSWLGAIVALLLAIGLLGGEDADQTLITDKQVATSADSDEPSSQDGDDGQTTTTRRTTTTTATRRTTTTTVPSADPVLEGDRAKVARVIDGDTIELTDGTRIRIAIVDTPEPNELCGSEATEFTRSFLADGEVIVRRPGPPYQDRFGRTLAEILRPDGASLNLELYRAGLGRIDDRFTHEDPDLASRLRAINPATASCRQATTTTAPPPPPPTTSPPPTSPPTSPPTTAPPASGGSAHPGAFCSPAGASGTTSAGTPMTCATHKCDGTPYDQPRWRRTSC